jgi:hypothetical protein
MVGLQKLKSIICMYRTILLFFWISNIQNTPKEILECLLFYKLLIRRNLTWTYQEVPRSFYRKALGNSDLVGHKTSFNYYFLNSERVCWVILNLYKTESWGYFCHPIEPHHQERESRLIARGWFGSPTDTVHAGPTVCLGGTHMDSWVFVIYGTRIRWDPHIFVCATHNDCGIHD